MERVAPRTCVCEAAREARFGADDARESSFSPRVMGEDEAMCKEEESEKKRQEVILQG